MNHYGVIMAGGGGTRFWPLSRQEKPKQLLNLSGKDMLVNEAVERMAMVIGKSNLFIITNDLQVPSMTLATVGKVFPRNIIAEPVPRNTTACIGYAAMEIVQKYGDGVMIVTPSDHYVEDIQSLVDTFKDAILLAEDNDKLVTIGITPYRASTAFGYIKYDCSECDERVKSVVGFKEKPDEETAKMYVKSGDYLWNSGIFVWKASLILQKMKTAVPDIFEKLQIIGNAMNTPDEQSVLHDVYPTIRPVAIDYSIMEVYSERGDVVVIPCDCGWNDLGSWDMMSVLHETDDSGNVIIGDVYTKNVRDSVIYSENRTVTVLDEDNLVVVETSDAVMVCNKEKAQNVKMIVEMLRQEGRKELL